MATAREVMRSVALRTGTAISRVEEVGNGLNRSGAWKGDEQSVVYLLLAVLADAEPKSAASIARHYYDLQLVGGGTPATAGEMIEAMLASFLAQARTDFSAYAYRSRIEVYSATPAIRIQTPCTDVPLDLTYLEHDPAAFHDSTVRRSNVMPGKTLFDVGADILSASNHVR